MEQVLEALGPADMHSRNSGENMQRGFAIIRMGSYLLKEKLQMQSTGTSFCIFLCSNSKLLLTFYYLLIFSLCLS